jgi:hypothetical protein
MSIRVSYKTNNAKMFLSNLFDPKSMEKRPALMFLSSLFDPKSLKTRPANWNTTGQSLPLFVKMITHNLYGNDKN